MLTVPVGCFCLAALQAASVGSHASTKLFYHRPVKKMKLVKV